MGKLIYSMNVSLDGYVETPGHSLEWANVDEELHGWFNDRAREVDASLYGRRMYELMAGYWPTAESDASATPAMLEFARIWKPMPKVVFSSTLSTVDWNSRLVRGPVEDELARLGPSSTAISTSVVRRWHRRSSAVAWSTSIGCSCTRSSLERERRSSRSSRARFASG